MEVGKEAGVSCLSAFRAGILSVHPGSHLGGTHRGGELVVGVPEQSLCAMEQPDEGTGPRL